MTGLDAYCKSLLVWRCISFVATSHDGVMLYIYIYVAWSAAWQLFLFRLVQINGGMQAGRREVPRGAEKAQISPHYRPYNLFLLTVLVFTPIILITFFFF